MIARTSTWTGAPEALQKWADHVTSHVSPMVRSLAGVSPGQCSFSTAPVTRR